MKNVETPRRPFKIFPARFMETFTGLVCAGEFFILGCINDNFIETFRVQVCPREFYEQFYDAWKES